jgi:phenylacetate-CoA ligase
MGKINGRSDDMLIIRGVNVFPSQIEELVLKMPALAPHYQLVLTREGHMDKLEVVTEARPDVPASQHEQLGRELEHNIKTFVGVSTKVTLAGAGGIERTQTGKARRVIDKRPKQ